MTKLPLETPVYMFLGFLESGKTKFIQETFEDPRFSAGEKTLLLVCEEGEEEYESIKTSYLSLRGGSYTTHWNFGIKLLYHGYTRPPR